MDGEGGGGGTVREWGRDGTNVGDLLGNKGQT